MRIVVMSDTHGNFDALYRLIVKQKDATQMFMHLGDGERELDHLSTLEPGLSIKHVRGNCDIGSMAPLCGIVHAGGVKIFITHGHTMHVKHTLGELERQARELGASIALYGHTHMQHYEYHDGLHLLSPGSLCQPRGGSAGYGVIEIRSGQILCNLAQV